MSRMADAVNGRFCNRNSETELLNSKLLPHPEEEKMNIDPDFELEALTAEENAGEETERSRGDNNNGSNVIYDYLGRPTSKSKAGGHKSSFFIQGMQFTSTMAYNGTVTNLVVYLTDKLHDSNASAASNVNNWSGAVYLCSLIGAFLGDAYWGRYLSSVVFLFIYLIGMILSTISVSLHSLRPPDCARGFVTCTKASTKQVGFFYFSIYVQALGCGAFQPCNTAFGADQFDEADPKEELEKSKYFSWLYLSSSAGGLIGNSLIVYLEQHQGYKLGYSISTAALGLSLLLYIAGTPLYRYKKLGENPFTQVFRVLIVAIRKFHWQVPSDAKLLYHGEQNQRHMLFHTTQFRFLDKAATITKNERHPWQLCTVTQVEEVKCLLRLMPMWATAIFCSTIYSQASTLFVEQASTMDTHMGKFIIPASSLNSIETLSVCICGLAYETLFVPIMRRFSGNPRGITMLQRMGVGIVLPILAIIIAAIVEMKRLQIVKHHELANDSTETVPMSVFWLVPPFFFIGASEIFAFIGQYEFFYDQAPDALRGIGSALQLSCFAMGSFLSSGLITVVTSITKTGNKPGWISNDLNNGHLDYFYWLLAILGILNFCLYLIAARWYMYRPVEEKSATW